MLKLTPEGRGKSSARNIKHDGPWHGDIVCVLTTNDECQLFIESDWTVVHSRLRQFCESNWIFQIFPVRRNVEKTDVGKRIRRTRIVVVLTSKLVNWIWVSCKNKDIFMRWGATRIPKIRRPAFHRATTIIHEHSGGGKMGLSNSKGLHLLKNF